MDYRNQSMNMAQGAGYASLGNPNAIDANMALSKQQVAYADAAPPKQTELDQIGNRIGASINDAALICDILGQIEDKLFGPVPQTASNPKDAGQLAGGGSISLANTGLDLLSDRLQRAQQIASRLRNAI